MTRICMTCGQKLAGRIDKKFCNASCRSDFHNNRKPIQGITEKLAMDMIRRNRIILNSLWQNGIHAMKKEELELCGFSFKGLTGIVEDQPGEYTLHCCEFSIRNLDETVCFEPEGGGYAKRKKTEQ